jgi:hypothetical protein
MLNALLLLGLHNLGFDPATPSERLDRVTPARRTHHTQSQNVWRDLKVHYISRSRGIHLTWSGRFEQTIKFPAYHPDKVGDNTWDWWLSDDESVPQRPKAFLYVDAAHPLLVFLAKRESGVYGIQSSIIYALHHDRWELLTVKPSLTEFTDRGAFYLQGNKLYVWDYAADDNYAHQAPQRYWLKTFIIKSDRLIKTPTHMTHHRYSIVEEYPAPTNYPAEKDPLREFGLRWRWWGDGRQVIQVQ